MFMRIYLLRHKVLAQTDGTIENANNFAYCKWAWMILNVTFILAPCNQDPNVTEAHLQLHICNIHCLSRVSPTMHCILLMVLLV